MGRAPSAFEIRGGNHTERPPRRIVNDDILPGDPDDDDVVIEVAALRQEHDDRLPGGQTRSQCRHRAVRGLRTPALRANGADEHAIGDACHPPSAMLDERGELPGVGVHVAPVPEDHGDRRSSTERIGLRDERHVNCRLSERQGRDER